MQRSEQGLATTIGYTFETDGTATDPSPDSATVTFTAPDGTVLLDAEPADDNGEGTFTKELTPSDMGALGVHVEEWTASFNGYEQTKRAYLEVVGGFFFTVSEARQKYPTLADKTWDEVATARTIAEDIIERALHFACVPRAKVLTLSGEGLTRASIPLYKIRAIQAVLVDGVLQDSSAYRIGSGAIYRTTTWPRSIGNVRVIVEHGDDFPSARIKDAAMMLTYHRAVKGPIDDRATSISAGDAGGTIQLLTPGVGEAITGIPEVDAAIIAERLPDPGSVSSVLTADSANTYPDYSDTFAIG